MIRMRKITEYGREAYASRMRQHLEHARFWIKEGTPSLLHAAIRLWSGWSRMECLTRAVHHLRLALRFANRACSAAHKSYIMSALNSLRGVAPQSAFTCYLGG